MINLGKLKEIKDLRKVWPHEALDFTPWLAEEDNLTLLADAVGLEITVDETESSVGDFNVDIYATETGTDRKIIIENQLEDTNHDHLGKLITYASGKSADIVIWVVKRAREEHRSAIEWLNEEFCFRKDNENIKFSILIGYPELAKVEEPDVLGIMEYTWEWPSKMYPENYRMAVDGLTEKEYYSRFVKGIWKVPGVSDSEVIDAVKKARSARFEFGETPKP